MLGTWSFTVESKLPNTPATYTDRWTAERIAVGTLVEDDFMAIDDQGVRHYLGVTIRAFDANTKQWTTAFVVPPANSWAIGKAWREGNEIAEGPDNQAKGRRARFSDITTDGFTWSLDNSDDGGRTWVNVVRVRAHRTQGSPR
jgi:hypothetical protein